MDILSLKLMEMINLVENAGCSSEELGARYIELGVMGIEDLMGASGKKASKEIKV